jgi:hypothetical protein
MQLLQLAQRLLAVTFALTLACTAPRSARAEEDYDPTSWSDWRSYTPSIAMGFGATIENTTSTAAGEAWIQNPPQSPNQRHVFSVASDAGLKGVSIQARVRLLAPQLDFPSRPRLFVHAGYTAQIQEPSTLAEYGSPATFWANSGNLPMRIAQIVDPTQRAHAGLGASFLLPLDSYPTRLNLHVNYAISHVEIVNEVWCQCAVTNPTGGYDYPTARGGTTQSLTTHEIAPGVGIDVDIDRLGPVIVGFFADFMLGIPFAGESIADVNAPPPGVRIDYLFERELSYDVALGLRLSWGEL